MNRRLAFGLLGLAVLLATAGCSTILGPGEADPADLAADASYDWNVSADAYLEVNKGNVTAVYRVANRTTGTREAENPTIEIYTRDTLGTEQPETVRAVKFRYPNGTLVEFTETNDGAVATVQYPNGTSRQAPDLMTVDRTRSRTVVALPANQTGRLGVTVPKNGKSVTTPAYVEGSYEVVLPERAEVGVPLLAKVRPSADRRAEVDDRVHVYWNQVTAPTLSVRYYLDRDLLLFGGLAAGATAIGLAGAGYYLLQLRETRRKREEVGLDVDIEDDDSRRPPPGMG
ncbi:DUF5803 family protein [Halosegnis sp.]|uniref:DUF5803 family protein n=1 Tax=Halosegnis sp. TaxID=2864959 RepID=UPI0035D4D834